MIEQISLKSGAAPHSIKLSIPVTPVTVFVGPNNAGKSRLLTELENWCRQLHGRTDDVLIDGVSFTPWSTDEIQKEILAIQRTPNPNEAVQANCIIIGKLNTTNNQMMRIHVHLDQLIIEAQNPGFNSTSYASFLNLHTVRLDGNNRLNLLNDQAAGNLKGPAANHLVHLFGDDQLRREVRRIMYEAFGKYFVIDPTGMLNLSVRLSNREPANGQEERGWDESAVEFHRAAMPIAQASDGVRAFGGIIATLVAGDPKVTLIDEPEAFLHPGLANKLGNEMAKLLDGTKDRLFVATHSASFLMGCIQAGVPLNIVRLTYNYASPTARILPREKLIPLMRHPLLRSAGVLSGLFYEAVVVTESDADRAFYQEINERLLAENDSRGISNCHFINAQNKQTVWEIVKPLRELGIPAVGIVDIDVLKEGGAVWNKPLEGAFFPELSYTALRDQRQAILNALLATGRNMKRDGGIALLTGTQYDAAEKFLKDLAEYGVFVVQNGELESWLKPLRATGKAPGWLIDIFETMGDDPTNPGYVRPAGGDVWNFIGNLKHWIVNPDRKGQPV